MGRDPQYDDIAVDFERHAQVQPWNALYDRPAVLDLVGDVRGLRVLDAGCGPGLYAQQLVERGADVVAFDQSAAMVDLTRTRVPTAEVRRHDLADDLDWVADGSIDLVVSALVWHYVDDRVKALRSFARVLRPGGAVVISTTHPTADWLRLGGSYFAHEVVSERWSNGWDMRFWRTPLTTTTAEFAEAGYVIERLVEPRPHPDMAATSPETFDRLSTSPNFIMFRLRLAAPG